jgi:hypothetical protein
MASLHPHSVVGSSDPECERRAAQLAAELEVENTGRREHTLLALAQLWFPLSSSFATRPPHAMPTPALLESVARCAAEPQKDSVRLAAIVATAAAWRALRVARQKKPADGPLEDLPAASIAVVRDALTAKQNALRLNAARLLAEVPLLELLPQLKLAAADPIWTVRWNAVRALSALEPDESLIAALQRSQPRDPTSAVAHDFRRAVEALTTAGLSLPPELGQYGTPSWLPPASDSARLSR